MIGASVKRRTDGKSVNMDTLGPSADEALIVDLEDVPDAPFVYRPDGEYARGKGVGEVSPASEATGEVVSRAGRARPAGQRGRQVLRFGHDIDDQANFVSRVSAFGLALSKNRVVTVAAKPDAPAFWIDPQAARDSFEESPIGV